eukprot:359718-Chlamydomonas_euryale.AAC.3
MPTPSIPITLPARDPPHHSAAGQFPAYIPKMPTPSTPVIPSHRARSPEPVHAASCQLLLRTLTRHCRSTRKFAGLMSR